MQDRDKDDVREAIDHPSSNESDSNTQIKFSCMYAESALKKSDAKIMARMSALRDLVSKRITNFIQALNLAAFELGS